jgi:hypothetical protein
MRGANVRQGAASMRGGAPTRLRGPSVRWMAERLQRTGGADSHLGGVCEGNRRMCTDRSDELEFIIYEQYIRDPLHRSGHDPVVHYYIEQHRTSMMLRAPCC